MDKKLIIIGAVIVVGVIGLIIYKSQSRQCDAASGQCAIDQNSSVAETNSSNNSEPTKADKILEQAKAKTAVIIDVREPFEYRAGHIEGAVLHPLGDLNEDLIAKYRDYDQIYVYCRSGNRASSAKQLFEENGFSKVTNIGGLTTDWVKLGGKIVK